MTSSNLTGRSLVLSRPKALNSLTHDMVLSIRKHLLEWRDSDLCDLVVLRSNSARAFCAGGDVVKVSRMWKDGNRAGAMQFFQDEYQTNHLLASYSKPVVALMDGITMGGGVGLSVHVPFRVATERTVFAMPETKIGFFPDVGATFFLPRLDGQTGVYLGLTGERLKGRDLVYAGIATHYVPSERLPQLEKRLQELGTRDYDVVNGAIEEFVGQPEGSEGSEMEYSLKDVREQIDECFQFNKVENIVDALRQTGGEWAPRTLKQLEELSPESLKLSLEQLRRGERLNIQQAFVQELYMTERKLHSSDLHEGIEALLVRKTKDPRWQPATLDEVNMRDLHQEYFEQMESAFQVTFINKDAVFSQYPHKFGLPTEEEVRKVVVGEDPEAGNMKMDRARVLEFFDRRYQKKVGVEGKVQWVLERKTRELDDSFGLQWQ